MSAESIVNHAATGILEILWQDGSRHQLSHAYLRHNCQCADCKSAHRADTEAPDAPGDIRIVDIVPVGAYAVQLVFSDGHVRGIFPWLYLKRLGDESRTQSASRVADPRPAPKPVDTSRQESRPAQ